LIRGSEFLSTTPPALDKKLDKKSEPPQFQPPTSPFASCHFPNFPKGNALVSDPNHFPVSICDQNNTPNERRKKSKKGSAV
jgi:hypothetical protein